MADPRLDSILRAQEARNTRAQEFMTEAPLQLLQVQKNAAQQRMAQQRMELIRQAGERDQAGLDLRLRNAADNAAIQTIRALENQRNISPEQHSLAVQKFLTHQPDLVERLSQNTSQELHPAIQSAFMVGASSQDLATREGLMKGVTEANKVRGEALTRAAFEPETQQAIERMEHQTDYVFNEYGQPVPAAQADSGLIARGEYMSAKDHLKWQGHLSDYEKWWNRIRANESSSMPLHASMEGDMHSQDAKLALDVSDIGGSVKLSVQNKGGPYNTTGDVWGSLFGSWNMLSAWDSTMRQKTQLHKNLMVDVMELMENDSLEEVQGEIKRVLNTSGVLRNHVKSITDEDLAGAYRSYFTSDLRKGPASWDEPTKELAKLALGAAQLIEASTPVAGQQPPHAMFLRGLAKEPKRFFRDWKKLPENERKAYREYPRIPESPNAQ